MQYVNNGNKLKKDVIFTCFKGLTYFSNNDDN